MTDQSPHDKKIIYHIISFNSTCLKFCHVFPQNLCYTIFQNLLKDYRDNYNNTNTPMVFYNSFHDPFCVYNVPIYISAQLDGTCHFLFIIFSIVTIDCTSPVPSLVNIFLTNPIGSIHLPSFNSNMAFRTSPNDNSGL